MPQVFTTFVELLPSEKQYTHHAIRKYDANLKSEFKKKKLHLFLINKYKKKELKGFYLIQPSTIMINRRINKGSEKHPLCNVV